jgi:hypothetical protein
MGGGVSGEGGGSALPAAVVVAAEKGLSTIARGSGPGSEGPSLTLRSGAQTPCHAPLSGLDPGRAVSLGGGSGDARQGGVLYCHPSTAMRCCWPGGAPVGQKGCRCRAWGLVEV